MYLGNNANINGFTLTNGGGIYGAGIYSEQLGVATDCIISRNWAGSSIAGIGGGAYGGTLYNCVLSANMTGGAEARTGGGACNSTLYNCTLTGNSATHGGGAYESTLYNCTLTANSGGGAYRSTLYNCLLSDNEGGSDGQFFNCTVIRNVGGISGTASNSIIYYNSGGNYAEETVLSYCCTSPLPTNGVGNITGSPLFMDMAEGDFRLWEGSPCIDAGADLTLLNVGYGYEPTDILGNTRFIDGNGDGKVAWDIGAYEFNSFKPPRFAVAPQLTTNGWLLNVTGEPNKWMRVQRSTNANNWEEIWSGSMGPDGRCQVTDSDMGQKVMFYRAVVLP